MLRGLAGLSAGGTLPSGLTIPNPTFTGIAGFGAGAVGAPSIYFTGDATTGWYRRGANQWTYTDQGTGTMELGGSQFKFISTGGMGWASGGITTATDTGIERASANSIKFGSTLGAGTATTRTEINKTVTGIADAVATATFTVTVPNAAHSGILEFEVLGILGAGGAIGTNEAVASATYKVSITRTPGVATVAVASAVAMAAAAAVAGAATVTCTAVVSAMSGAVGATQTFTLNVTITRSGGSSTNHIALCYGKLLNLNASGITIA